MANQNPPWAAYRAFISERLILLDKLPGVRPVGIEETWRRLFTKCVLKVTVTEATHAYKDYQICVRLKAGIYGAVHLFQYIWYANST